MSRHQLLLVSAALIFQGLLAPAVACQMLGVTTADTIRWPAILAEGRIEAIRKLAKTSRCVASLRVSRASKGVRADERVEFSFERAGTSCSSEDGFKVGRVAELSLWGTGAPYRLETCIDRPIEAAVTAYREGWEQRKADAERRPDDKDAQLKLADYLSAWGDNAGALRIYDILANRSSDDCYVQASRALNLMLLERREDAEHALAKAFAVNKGCVRARVLGIVLSHRADRARVGVDQRWNLRSRHAFWHDDLTGADFRAFPFNQMELIGLRAPRSNWSGAVLYHASLDGASLPAADLTDVNFKWTGLSAVDLSGAKAPRAFFWYSTLGGLKAPGLVAPMASFNRATMTGADLTGADLRGATFNYAILNRVSLRNAKLDGARFDESDLRGTDLRGASLTDASFLRAKVDCITRFPEGFDLAGQQLAMVEPCEK